jgi:Uma2 family endonuclease
MAALPRETVALKEQSSGPNASSDQLVRRFTLEEFEEMVNLLPDDQLELINGETIMSPPPDDVHIEHTINVEYLLAKQLSQIEKLGCRVVVRMHGMPCRGN